MMLQHSFKIIHDDQADPSLEIAFAQNRKIERVLARLPRTEKKLEVPTQGTEDVDADANSENALAMHSDFGAELFHDAWQ